MKTAKYAVIGYPIGHTMSPFIHGRLFKLSGVSADYSVFEIAPKDLSQKFEMLSGLDGFNVTIPHKSKIIPFLKSLDERAKLYGAVNVVKCDSLKGYNTDCFGFLRALASADIPLKGNVAVCGAGGVARMMAFECALAGCSLTIAARLSDLGPAETIKDEIVKAKPDADINIKKLDELSGGFDLLINGTPVGMYPHAGSMPVSGSVLSKCAAVFDAVYNPNETLLIKTAASNGSKCCGGMPMLVWQAVVAQEIWNRAEFKEEDIKLVIEDARSEMAKKFSLR